MKIVHLGADSAYGLKPAVSNPRTVLGVSEVRVAGREVLAPLNKKGRHPRRVILIEGPRNADKPTQTLPSDNTFNAE
jgi:hypothetical protein